MRAQLLDMQRLLHNTCHKLTWAKGTTNDSHTKAKDTLFDAKCLRADLERSERLVESLKKDKNTLCMRDNCASQKRDAAVNSTRSFSLKEKGVFTEPVQEMAHDLTSICQVPVARVNSVIHAVAKEFGIRVNGSMDKHSAARITLKGQVASDIQLIQEIHNAGGMFYQYLLIMVNPDRYLIKTWSFACTYIFFRHHRTCL